ncbi:vWA domain-containing protein [Mesohalobacter halotolerans]|uniref:VWA domain-containing protein n=1 Tax=Mesohalobacter halotolerans TaxID=1883405 RepID=A0A4U5TRW3_9FLAO|nr:VWA domain-containing protein [Mesohalobacter halotolerans]MBS3739097.1 VWA domain-containing protein [Psychroflexus sp.]TKS57017.1 VWA domain-containing protein [Mesohalobacter halotolerans]
MFNDLTFENPAWFWLLLAIPLFVVWYLVKRKQSQVPVKFSSTQAFSGSTFWGYIKHVMFSIKILAWVFLTIAMARPRTVDVTTDIKKTRGIDIVMSIDISASMLAKDFRPNRMEVVKEVASEFVKNRPNDRIGLVVFSGESYTKTPVTSDKSIVLNTLKDISYSSQIEGGTAIGMGLATAVNRLKYSEAKGKVIILLTDGVNNTGFIEPKTAADLALEYDIKVYSIGVGSIGTALSPVAIDRNGQFQYRNTEVEIDEALLDEISSMTDGQYFRATNEDKLKSIYEEINKLEKTEIKETKYYNYDEKYPIFVIIAGLLIAFVALIKYTIMRSLV